MRKIYSTITIPVLLINIILCSCSSTNSLTISVTEPAPVYVPSDIKSAGIIDRSLPSGEKDKEIDKLDKILSAEGKNLDKEGAKESVVGLFDELMKNNRFSEVKIIDRVNVRSPGHSTFPSPLSWNTIEQICYENNVDAIFVLSFYDTDTKIDYKAVPVEVGGLLKIKIPVIEHHAAIATLIETGWRIYDPINKLILDEFFINETVVLKGVGINPVKAIEAVMGRKEAVLQASNNIGYNYGLRILPYRVRVARRYYVRGTNNFEIAKRRAQTDNWDGAAELWDKEVSSPKRKVAGRACYNMAIINEINGDLNAAVEWTSKSYTDYKNKMALRYLNVLKYRIERKIQLEQQMEY